MSTPEQTYCRSPLAKVVNQHPEWLWMPTHNTGNGNYDSGFPDGIAVKVGVAATAAETVLLGTLACQMMSYTRLSGKIDIGFAGIDRMVYVECKAFFGAIPLGEEEGVTTGWHSSQRNWWRTVVQDLGITYKLLVWAYPDYTKPKRILQTKAKLFLVDPMDWLLLEDQTDRKSMSLSPETERVHAYKDRTVMNFWEGRLVTFKTLLEKL